MKRLLILTFGTTVMLVCMLMLSREIYGNEIPKETIETGNAIGESIITYFRHAVRYGDALEACGALERPAADRADSLRHGVFAALLCGGIADQPLVAL